MASVNVLTDQENISTTGYRENIKQLSLNGLSNQPVKTQRIAFRDVKNVQHDALASAVKGGSSSSQLQKGFSIFEDRAPAKHGSKPSAIKSDLKSENLAGKNVFLKPKQLPKEKKSIKEMRDHNKEVERGILSYDWVKAAKEDLNSEISDSDFDFCVSSYVPDKISFDEDDLVPFCKSSLNVNQNDIFGDVCQESSDDFDQMLIRMENELNIFDSAVDEMLLEKD